MENTGNISTDSEGDVGFKNSAPSGYAFEPVIVAGLHLSDPSEESDASTDREDGGRLLHVQ